MTSIIKEMADRLVMLSDEEIDTLFLRTEKGGQCTKKELYKLFKWAQETRLRSAILEGILKDNNVCIKIGRGGEPIYIQETNKEKVEAGVVNGSAMIGGLAG